MYRIFRFAFILAIGLFASIQMRATSLNGGDLQISSLHYSLDSCEAYVIAGSVRDYSEFIGIAENNLECALITPIGTVHRDNPLVNSHSCTPGVNNSLAMCISSEFGCDYIPDNEKALRFDVLVNPVAGAESRLSELSFFEQAPDNYLWIDGPSGLNNYPTKFGLRVLKNGVEIYREEDLSTQRDWNLVSFDFSDLPGFDIYNSSVFSFELLPYCPVGNNSMVSAWDIDEINLSVSCGSIAPNGGSVCFDDGTKELDICGVQGAQATVSVQLTDNSDVSSAWVLTDINGNIIELLNTPPFNLNYSGYSSLLIYHIAYEGSLTGLQPGNNVENIQGCFGFSNALEIHFIELTPNILTTISGGQSVDLCVNSGGPYLINVSLSSTSVHPNIFVITDNAGTVLELPGSPPFTIDADIPGQCRIYNLSYFGNLDVLVPGANINTLDACYVFSEAVLINKEEAEGGSINVGGAIEQNICVDNSISLTEISPSLSNAVGENFYWIVTDLNNTILDIFNGLPVFLDNSYSGSCKVWHISSYGIVTALSAGSNLSDLSGCFDLSNSITINKMEADSPTISVNGSLNLSFCNDPAGLSAITPEISNVSSGGVSWIVADENGVIIQITDSLPLDLSTGGAGVCSIYALNYMQGSHGLSVGDNISSITSSCQGLSNAVNINKLYVEGGVLSINGGVSTVVCSPDGPGSDIAVQLSGNTGAQRRFILTNTNGTILSIQDSQTISLTANSPDTCLAYNISYEGFVNGLNSGMPLTNLSGCFDLSNSIQLIKEPVSGGIASTIQGTSSVNICTTSGDLLMVEVQVWEQIGNNFTWIVTDLDNNILSVQSSSVFDFSTYSNTQLRIYHVAYNGQITGLNAGGNTSNISGDCFDLSNAVTVNISSVDGGVLSTDRGDEITICASDGNPDLINVRLENNVGPNSLWLMTDINGVIVRLLPAPPFDVDDGGNGTRRIWHLSFSNNIFGLSIGANLQALQGCYDLSNSITVIKEGIEPGVLTSNRGNPVVICTAQQGNATVQFNISGNAGFNNLFVVTDDDGNILSTATDGSISFENSQAGTCYVQHISYESVAESILAGINLADIDGCFAISNTIEVQKLENNGGTLSSNQGDEIIYCEESINPADISITVSGAFGQNSAWILTANNGVISQIRNTSDFDFSGIAQGTCQVWHISFSDNLSGLAAGNLIDDLQGCYDLSNSIDVLKFDIQPGIITSNLGDDVIICANDALPDFIEIDLAGANGQRNSYVVSESDGTIISVSSNSLINFANSLGDSCFIQNLSYNGSIEGLVAGLNLSDITGCYALSNVVTVRKTSNQGGEISSTLGDTISICLDDNITDIINFSLEGQSGENSMWILSDSGGNILETSTSSSFDFSDTAGGSCKLTHISYSNGLIGLETGNNTDDLDGCFDLSNTLVVNKTNVESGTLSSSRGDTVTVCLEDGRDDSVEFQLSGSSSTLQTFILTDDRGNILEITEQATFNFENYGEGICRVWSLAYEQGIEGLSIGLDILDLNGCYALSNSIYIDKNINRGGTIDVDGDTSYTICTNDSESLNPQFNLINEQGENSIWLLTNTNGLILDISESPDFGFLDSSESICLVWHLSYSDGLTGLSIGNTPQDLEGCYDLSNSLEIIKTSIESTTLTSSNSQAIEICLNEGTAANIVFNATGLIDNFSALIVTDLTGNIIDIDSDFTLDLSNAVAGECLVYHINAPDTITGLLEGSSLDDLEGCYALSNAVSVIKSINNGGIITSDLGDQVFLCLNDSEPDIINLTVLNATGENFAWLLLDASNQILEISSNPVFDFEGFSIGECSIRHIAYTDGLTGLEEGSSLNAIDGCFDLSNSIGIVKEFINGGQLETDLGSVVEFCVNDGSNDILNFTVSGNTGQNNALIIYDDSGLIIDVQVSYTLDFENYTPGSYLIQNISFDTQLSGLSNGLDISEIEGCYELSNSIELLLKSNNGGDIVSDQGAIANFCVDDDLDDIIELDVQGNTGDNFIWLLLDAGDNILQISDAPLFDLSSFASGDCSIVHLSYSDGLMGLDEGASLNDLQGCFDLSNRIEIFKTDIHAGTLNSNLGNDVVFCVNDGEQDVITVSVTGSNALVNQIVVTDADGNILDVPGSNSIDFEGSLTGMSFIWNVASSSSVNALSPGSNIDNLQGCFEISNSIKVTQIISNGGTIQAEGKDTIYICAGDGLQDFIDFELIGEEGENFAWVLTDQAGNIIGINQAPDFAFDNDVDETQYVYHLSYSGSISNLTESSNIALLQGCYDLSNGVVVISRTVTQAVLESSMGDAFEICVDDMRPDEITFSIFGQQSESNTLLVTDEQGVILSIPQGFTFDLDNNETGVCLVWNLSYNFELVGLEVGQSVENLVGCFELSNAITVNKTIKDAGSISINGDDEYIICAGDGTDDFLSFDKSGGTNNGVSTWLVTTETGEILNIQNSLPINFEDAEEDICLVWHLCYTAGLQGLEIGENANDLDGCFDLSNPVSIIKSDPGIISESNSMLVFNFDECYADTQDGSNKDYSEFSAQIMNDSNCTQFELIDEFLFRRNPMVNMHSCTEGYEGLAMCVDGLDSCDFEADSDNAVRFSVQLTAGASGYGSLTNLSFFEQAPFRYDWINGPGGLNNYPTLYGIRILKDGEEIFRKEGVETSLNWNFQEYDFSDSTDFYFEETAVFDFELLGYCLVGNDMAVAAWDLDNLKISSICREGLIPGLIATADGNTEATICVENGFVADLDINVLRDSGSESFWLITDNAGNYLDVQDALPIDLSGSLSDTCYIYYVSTTGTNSLLNQTDPIDLQGCYVLSNPIKVIKLEGNECQDQGQLTEGDRGIVTRFSIHPNPATETIAVKLEHEPAYGTQIFIYDKMGRMMSSESLQSKEKIYPINHYMDGFYYVRIVSGEESVVRKFMKL